MEYWFRLLIIGDDVRVIGTEVGAQDEMERHTNFHVVMTAFENIGRYETTNNVRTNYREFVVMLQVERSGFLL
jgi:hypothetical protein